MYSQSGEINGISWSTNYLGDRNFKLNVGDLTRDYSCMYEPVFGLDTYDVQRINEILDVMQDEIETR